MELRAGGRFRLSRDSYFDRKAVTDVVDAKRQKVLGRQGSLVMTIARRSIRRRKKPSKPGQPPSAHSKSLGLRDGPFAIDFAYDRSTDTVVIGASNMGKNQAPSILEFGGTVPQRGVISHGGEFIPLRLLSRESLIKIRAHAGAITTKQAKVDPRPYMAPAAEKAKPMLAKQWEKQIRK